MTLLTAAGTDVVLATEHVFDYQVLLRPPLDLGRGPAGRRLFYEAVGGTISGPRLSGEVLRGGGDWATVGDDGWTRLDVRGHCRTNDGALLFFVYDGVLETTEAFLRAVSTGGETSFDDHYWRVSIRVETDDPRYRWLTRSALVGRGRICSGPGVAYQVFRTR